MASLGPDVMQVEADEGIDDDDFGGGGPGDEHGGEPQVPGDADAVPHGHPFVQLTAHLIPTPCPIARMLLATSGQDDDAAGEGHTCAATRHGSLGGHTHHHAAPAAAPSLFEEVLPTTVDADVWAAAESVCCGGTSIPVAVLAATLWRRRWTYRFVPEPAALADGDACVWSAAVSSVKAIAAGQMDTAPPLPHVDALTGLTLDTGWAVTGWQRGHTSGQHTGFVRVQLCRVLRCALWRGGFRGLTGFVKHDGQVHDTLQRVRGAGDADSVTGTAAAASLTTAPAAAASLALYTCAYPLCVVQLVITASTSSHGHGNGRGDGETLTHTHSASDRASVHVDLWVEPQMGALSAAGVMVSTRQLYNGLCNALHATNTAYVAVAARDAGCVATVAVFDALNHTHVPPTALSPDVRVVSGPLADGAHAWPVAAVELMRDRGGEAGVSVSASASASAVALRLQASAQFVGRQVAVGDEVAVV